MLRRLILFFILNFAALAIGGIFTGKGVPSEWYAGLIKAPWTPPGWVFGAAWTTIMACLSLYMAYLWPLVTKKKLLIALYLVQLILNIGWNPTFFYFNNIPGGLLLISTLSALVGFMLIFYFSKLRLKSLLLAPYLIWLIIATSLNAYILLNN